ncbi:DUF262 domain-containing protein [Peribacillus loiseleuriae]|uniref:DUF262 domain-containing protein n=1 Tax=Peribacillus loiseleuriae TaxID=1679170 RepID=UPI000670CCD9|nr:DUF262 domain-containing protein [Peribacillus loiseleuriae]
MAKKIKKTEEELKAERLEYELNEVKEKLYLIPEPIYTFEIGQQVGIGNLKDVIVKNSLEGGKIYLIDYTSVDHNRGNPIRHEHRLRYVTRLDIRKLPAKTESFIRNKNMRLNYSNQNIASLLSKAYYFGVNFDLDYQREYVWELGGKVNLNDSVFNNIDIGKFVFVRYNSETWSKLNLSYEVLDGKQRMRAILDYYEDRFEYEGKKFSDLTLRDQGHFENYPIPIAEIDELPRKGIIRFFIALNTNGKVMDSNHLDNVRKMIEE